MQVLFCTQPGFGHVLPLVPLAKTLQARGHSVTIASARSVKRLVESHGLTHLEAGFEYDECRLADTLPEIRSVPEDKQGRWLMDEVMYGKWPMSAVPTLSAVIQRYDVALSTNYDISAMLAAEKAGIPYVNCNIGGYRMPRKVIKIVQGKRINGLRRHFGLPDDPDFMAFGRYLDLRFMPMSFSFVNVMASKQYRSFLRRQIFRRGARRGAALGALIRAEIVRIAARKFIGANFKSMPNERFVNIWQHDPHASQAPDWVKSLPRDRPTVYVSLGTVFSSQYPQVFEQILEAFASENVNLIITVGSEVDPTRFGSQPTHMHIHRYIPQEQLLPYVDLMLCHAGPGTVNGALSYGIPIICFPLAGDQSVTASVVVAEGACVPLPDRLQRVDSEGAPMFVPQALTVEDIRSLAREGLSNPSYREAAQRIAREMQALTTLDEAAELVEKIVGCPARMPLSDAA